MARRVQMGGKRLLAIYHKDISHALIYHQGHKYYLRDVRYAFDNLSVSINPTLSVTQVYHSDRRSSSENISVSINPTLSVTQVYHSDRRSSHENISVSIVPTLALIRVSLENPSPL